jgi:acetyltransferase
MTIRNLDRMFKPSSVVLIGASDRPGSVGQVVLRNLRSSGFAGPIGLVNLKHHTIDGLPCYRDVDGLPDAPDLAVVAMPAATVPGIIAQLARRGTAAPRHRCARHDLREQKAHERLGRERASRLTGAGRTARTADL